MSPRFQVLSQIAQDLADRVARMTDDELRKLLRSCRRVSGTNCWWLIYWLAPTIESCAKHQLHSRTYKRREEKKKARVGR